MYFCKNILCRLERAHSHLDFANAFLPESRPSGDQCARGGGAPRSQYGAQYCLARALGSFNSGHFPRLVTETVYALIFSCRYQCRLRAKTEKV